MQSAETVLDVLREHHDHDIVTGEPGDRKRSRRVREGGVGKGPARAPRRRRTSAKCHPGAIERRWTREVVLAAMREWRDRYGRLPSSYDWSRTHARRRGGQALERLGSGDWPAASVVTSLFGTWAEACDAAVEPGGELPV
jgi:hypothetical protein